VTSFPGPVTGAEPSPGNLGRRIRTVRFWPKSLRFDRDPVAVVLPEPLATDVRRLLVSDRYVDAVRLVRQRTHLNLMPAVLAVNAVRDRAGP
jgi:hypothetical protein